MSSLKTLVLILLITCVTALAGAHTLASTFTTIEWNHDDSSLEVIVEGHSHEMEVLLSLEVGEQISFLEDAHFDRLVEAAGKVMLRDISIRADGGEPLAFTYVGLEMKGQTVYAYMEADLEKTPEQLVVANHMFLRLVPGQINRIMAVKGKERRGDDITADRPEIKLDFTRPQPKAGSNRN